MGYFSPFLTLINAENLHNSNILYTFASSEIKNQLRVMENSFSTTLKWILVFTNFFVIILSLQSLSNKIERLEEKTDKVSIQCDSLQNELIGEINKK